MSLFVEKVYQDTGSELTAAGFTTSIAGAKSFHYDGRYLWVACTAGIGIYEFWGAASNHEPAWETLDDLVYSRYDSGPEKKLKLITFIAISTTQIRRATRYVQLSLRPDIVDATPDGAVVVGGITCTLTTINEDLRVITEVSTNATGIALAPAHMAQSGDKLYVSGENFTSIFVIDIPTQRFVEVITLPIRTGSISQIADSNMVAAGGKLWFVNTFFDDATPQRLYSYTPGDAEMAFTNIPVRPSTTKQYLADGFNGFVYLTNFNNVSIGKINVINSTWTTIRLNAFPQRIWSDQNRRIFVNSAAGMLSLVDWDDNQVHNDYSTDSQALGLGFDADTTKLWWVDGVKLVRHSLSTKQQIETGTAEDWGFAGSFPAGAPTVLYVSAQQTYQKEDLGTVTVKPYVFIAYPSAIACFRVDQWLMYRKSYTELNGQGAVVAGDEEYFGET